MATKYKIRTHYSYEDDGTTVKSSYKDIEDTELKLGIPMCEENRHYKEYLKWVEEGNTADTGDA